MNFVKWFNSQSRIIQIVLLIIPGVNWIIEILVRWSKFLQDKDIVSLIVAILFTVFGMVFGYVDLIWVLLFNHLLLAA